MTLNATDYSELDSVATYGRSHAKKHGLPPYCRKSQLEPALLPLHSRSARRFVGSAPTGCLPLYLPPCLKSCCAEAVGLLRSSFNYSLLLQSLEELKQQPLAWLPCIHVLSVCLAGWLVHAGM